MVEAASVVSPHLVPSRHRIAARALHLAPPPPNEAAGGEPSACPVVVARCVVRALPVSPRLGAGEAPEVGIPKLNQQVKELVQNMEGVEFLFLAAGNCWAFERSQ
ncbi:hypothetical protein ABZP36_009845 [Zizania latifolia]